MNEKIYDLITIGGGPSGLICAITGITGIPINHPQFTGLVIDKFETGEFCKFGKLRITNKWFFMGHRIIDILSVEAKHNGLEFLQKEEVKNVDFTGDIKTVTTDKGIYKGRKVAICTGFFPHGNFMRYMEHLRVMFSPIEMEVNFIPQEKDYSMVILGCGKGTAEIARKLKSLRPDLKCLLVLENMEELKEDYKDIDIYYGSLKINESNERGLNIALTDSHGKEREDRQVRYMLVDYNSYTLNTDVTSFLNDRGLNMVKGYIKVDSEGNTGIPGVVAAGNIVTPVSGVLTALATGFAAGLNIFSQLHKEKFNKAPLYFPWLPSEGMEAHPLVSRES